MAKKKRNIKKAEVVEKEIIPEEELKPTTTLPAYTLKKNFTKQYKIGDVMPENVVQELQARGIDLSDLFE